MNGPKERLILDGSAIIRWHPYRASDWAYKEPPEGDYSRCGDCGDLKDVHPKPHLVVRDQVGAARAFLVLADGG